MDCSPPGSSVHGIFLGIYPEKNMTRKDICTPVFIAALFTIAKTWEQAKCPLTEERIKMRYIYTMEYYSAIKMNEIMPFAAMWKDLKITMLSKLERQIYDITYMWKLKKMIQKNLLSNRLTVLENKLMVTKGEGGEEG